MKKLVCLWIFIFLYCLGLSAGHDWHYDYKNHQNRDIFWFHYNKGRHGPAFNFSIKNIAHFSLLGKNEIHVKKERVKIKKKNKTSYIDYYIVTGRPHTKNIQYFKAKFPRSKGYFCKNKKIRRNCGDFLVDIKLYAKESDKKPFYKNTFKMNLKKVDL